MDPVIWVALIGNGATVAVALFGRWTHREQIEATAGVERERIEATTESVRDERREAARRERREFYGRLLAVILQLQRFGDDDPPALSDADYLAVSAEYAQLHAEAFLVGTEGVAWALSGINGPMREIADDMARFPGGPAEQFRAALRQSGRRAAVATGVTGLISAMRYDVTVPHL
jgi:hypothetical protein